MAKYSVVMTPTPCRVDGCITSIRHSRTYLLTKLLGGIKPAISPKRLKIERLKLLLTNGLSIADKMTLNDLCVKFKVIDSLNAAKNGEMQLY